LREEYIVLSKPGKTIQLDGKTKFHQAKITGLKKGETYFYEAISYGKNYVFDARHEFKMGE